MAFALTGKGEEMELLVCQGCSSRIEEDELSRTDFERLQMLAGEVKIFPMCQDCIESTEWI